MAKTVNEALLEAIRAHKDGDISRAERIYRAILLKYPRHPDANHNLGLLLAPTDYLEAKRLLEKALTLRPDDPTFTLSNIKFLLNREDIEGAKTKARAALAASIRSEKLDVLYRQLQLRLNSPTHPGKLRVNSKAHLNLSSQKHDHEKQADQEKKLFNSYQNREYKRCITLAKKIQKRHPKNRMAYSVKSAIYLSEGKIDAASKELTKAVSVYPEDAEIRNMLGITFQKELRHQEAVEQFEKSISIAPSFFEAYLNLAASHKSVNNIENALEVLNKALAFRPKASEAYLTLGLLHSDIGNFKPAIKAFEKALQLKPTFARAHYFLSRLKKYEATDKQIRSMENLYESNLLGISQKALICFALAKVYEDLSLYKTAFSFYLEANALRKSELSYQFDLDEKRFQSIKSTFHVIKDKNLLLKASQSNLTPIFIVGMPRSGTTITEQIISAHPLVSPGGELPHIAEYGSSLVFGEEKITNEKIQSLRKKYLTKLGAYSRGCTIVTDKQPQNFLYLSLILKAFPEAKIIHCRRDPAALCWGNFKQYFENPAIGYCYNLDDIIQYFKHYQDLMSFWGEHGEGRIYQLDYERLTIEQENVTRELLQYLEIDFDRACLFPEKNTRQINTASNVQARKKVYSGSSLQWKHYEQLLEGAFDPVINST